MTRMRPIVLGLLMTRDRDERLHRHSIGCMQHDAAQDPGVPWLQVTTAGGAETNADVATVIICRVVLRGQGHMMLSCLDAQ
jgi:hypothetical protein